MKLSSTAGKILVTSLIFASATGLAVAKGDYKGECPMPPMLKGGFYLGGQVGFDSYRVREDIDTPSTSDIVANPAINATGIVGGLLIGYGQYFNMYYLGGELFANWTGADHSYSITDNVGTYNNQFEADSSYGLALLPGIKLNDPTLGYLRFGWNWAYVKGKENITGGVSTSKSNTSNGFNWGLGMETLLVDNWSLRAEASHTSYDSFTSTFSTKFNPSDNQFMVGLIYHI